MTAQFVTDALMMAVWRRGKPDALLHHSDRGSQYTSEQFQRLMADNGIVCSHEPIRQCLGQRRDGELLLLAENRTHRRKTYRTRNEARADVFDYIERFYNPSGVTRRSDTSARLSSSARWD